MIADNSILNVQPMQLSESSDLFLAATSALLYNLPLIGDGGGGGGGGGGDVVLLLFLFQLFSRTARYNSL